MALAMCLTLAVPAFATPVVEFELTAESTVYTVEENKVTVSFLIKYDSADVALDTAYADLDYDADKLTLVEYKNMI